MLHKSENVKFKLCIRKISNKHVEKLLIYSIIGEKKVIHYIGDRDGIPCNQSGRFWPRS